MVTPENIKLKLQGLDQGTVQMTKWEYVQTTTANITTAITVTTTTAKKVKMSMET